MTDLPFEYFPACDEPLSADVFIFKGAKENWVFDVGNGEPYSSKLNELSSPKNAVLSHFHGDHTANMKTVSFSNIYAGKYTAQYIKDYAPNVTVVDEDIFIEDGDLKLHIFRMPSSHCKSSVALEVNDEYIFMGDSAYGCIKDEKTVFNVSSLYEQIEVLKSLKGTRCVLSHERRLVFRKETIIRNMERVLKKQEKNNPFVCID